MKVLVACEYSGRVRQAFRAKGHDAWSCDLLPSDDNSEFHIQGDVALLLAQDWDLLIAHPPCTYLCNSGVSWLHRTEGRWQKMVEGAEFFSLLWQADIPKICVENPVMHKYAKEIIGASQTQSVQPWQFGEDASKRTCLWLRGLPQLQPTDVIIKDRYANQTPSGRCKLGPSEDRWKLRSVTYQGIADAMAEQWGSLP
jgi:hypothetical protein|tara:strand:+ start:1307 stop:1900 length:594 start_codon:yes stop_codon:yes gene_type:complete